MRSMVLGVVAACMLGAASLAASDALDAVVGPYLQIQAKLASDSIDGIKAPARQIAEHAPALGERGAAIAKAASAVEAATDLKTARDAFEPLSEAVVAAAKAEGWKGLDGVKLAYCPMVKASWLQKGDTIRNPYYGSAMLECGEFRKPQ